MLRVKIIGKLPKIPTTSNLHSQTVLTPNSSSPTLPTLPGKKMSRNSIENSWICLQGPWGPHHDQIKEGICLNRLPEVVGFVNWKC